MLVKMLKPGGKTMGFIESKDVDAYLKRGWSLAVKKTEKKVRKKKVEVIEEPIIETNDEQLNLDLNEEQD
jgi:hypothetical protein